MSKTVSVGVVGPSHWAYMASVMAEKLQAMRDSGETNVARIPPGVLRDAREFYNLVLDAAGEKAPVNPPASINAYALAADAVRAVSGDASRADVGETLGKQKELLDGIQEPRKLDSEELHTLSSLHGLFLWLKQEGESDAYEHTVAFGATARLRLS